MRRNAGLIDRCIHLDGVGKSLENDTEVLDNEARLDAEQVSIGSKGR